MSNDAEVETDKDNPLKLYIDASTRDGLAGGGVILTDNDDTVQTFWDQELGEVNGSTQAEVRNAELALSRIGSAHVKILTDSEQLTKIDVDELVHTDRFEVLEVEYADNGRNNPYIRLADGLASDALEYCEDNPNTTPLSQRSKEKSKYDELLSRASEKKACDIVDEIQTSQSFIDQHTYESSRSTPVTVFVAASVKDGWGGGGIVVLENGDVECSYSRDLGRVDGSVQAEREVIERALRMVQSDHVLVCTRIESLGMIDDEAFNFAETFETVSVKFSESDSEHIHTAKDKAVSALENCLAQHQG